MPALNITDLNNGKLDLDHIAAEATSSNLTATDRLGTTKLTLAGALEKMGYEAPVAYAGSIPISRATQTITYSGVQYAPDPAALPFTTTVWGTDAAKFPRIVQGVTTAILAETGAAADLGAYDGAGGTIFTKVQGAVDASLPNYAINPATMAATKTRLFGQGGGAMQWAMAGQTLATGAPLKITGGVPVIGGLSYDHKFAPITSPDTATNAFEIGNVTGSVAHQYRNEFSLRNISAVGAGKGGTSAGIYQVDAANVRLDGAILRNFSCGFKGVSALSCDYRDLSVTENGIGISLGASGPLTEAEPNALRFYGFRAYGNDRAISMVGGPNASTLWASGNIEGNNLAGNPTDGRAVTSLTLTGEQVFIATHHEGNLGEVGTYYQGNDFTKVMTMLGVQHIDGTDTGVHIETGTLLGLGSRIYSSVASKNVFLADGASSSLIETETAVSGDLSNLAVMRFGKLGFGQNAVRSSPCISASSVAIANGVSNSSINVASRFDSDVSMHEWGDAAGTRLGYEGWYKVYDTEFMRTGAYGFNFYSNGSTKILNVGRIGNASIEPGNANAIDNGSAALPWKDVYSVNAVTVTSDETKKTNLTEASDVELDAWADVQIFFFQWIASVQEKGDAARRHCGPMAQAIWRAFNARGLDPFRYGLLCHNKLDAGLGDTKRLAEFDVEFTARSDRLIGQEARRLAEIEVASHAQGTRDAVVAEIHDRQAAQRLELIAAGGDDMFAKLLEHDKATLSGRPKMVNDAIALVEAALLEESTIACMVQAKKGVESAHARRRADMERRITPAQEAGETWGIRAEQCLFLEALWNRREHRRTAQQIESLIGMVTGLGAHGD